jgi:hypothetical protein
MARNRRSLQTGRLTKQPCSVKSHRNLACARSATRSQACRSGPPTCNTHQDGASLFFICRVLMTSVSQGTSPERILPGLPKNRHRDSCLDGLR